MYLSTYEQFQTGLDKSGAWFFIQFANRNRHTTLQSLNKVMYKVHVLRLFIVRFKVVFQFKKSAK